MDMIFYISLIFAVAALLLSLLSEKYWTKKRTTAVLINVGGPDYLDDEKNRCKCDPLDLTNKYYQAEFGGQKKHFDGITVRAVIEGMKPHEVRAKVFLSDGVFVINGNMSIIPRSRFDDERFYYDLKKEKKYTDTKEDVRLFDHDLIFIKDKARSTVASFMFLRADSIEDAERIRYKKIVVENQEPMTTEVKQDAE